MVHVDVSIHALVWFRSVGIVFLVVVVPVVLHIVLVPVLKVFLHFGVDVPVLVEEVYTLIEVDDDVEQFLDAFPAFEHGRYHRHAEQLSQFLVVNSIAPVFKLVKHVEGTHHAQVHVDELCGQVEVSFDVRGVNHIDDDVGSLLYNLLAYIQFFRTVCGERVGARQVHDVEFVPLKRSVSLLGVNSHARIVADPFVGARHEVEERCLSAVGVSHQCHVDGAPFFHGCILELFLGQCRFVSLWGYAWLVAHFACQDFLSVPVCQFYILGFFFGYDFNHARLVVTE